jgi:hypothetical protein
VVLKAIWAAGGFEKSSPQPQLGGDHSLMSLGLTFWARASNSLLAAMLPLSELK